MWRKFAQLLGKCVQGVKKIFRRRETKAPVRGNEIKLRVLDGKYTIPYIEEDENIEQQKININNKPVTFTCDNTQIDISLLEEIKEDTNSSSWTFEMDFPTYDDVVDKVKEMLKNSANTSRTNLPKRTYHADALLISIAANQESEYYAADFSQYEERSLVHIIHGRRESVDQIEAEYRRDTGDQETEFIWSEEGLCTALLLDAEVWEEDGIWYCY